MTEAEWAACANPQPMLDYLRGKGGSMDRKLRLFAAACSRRVWSLLDDLGRGAVEMAEHFADGLVGADELRTARLACRHAGAGAAWYAAASDPAVAARNAYLSAQAACSDAHAESLMQADILRDVFGNPFRPVHQPRQTPTVAALAQAVYGSQDFGQLPALADAVGQAGCSDADILGHLREPGLHVRGCWAIDLLRAPNPLASGGRQPPDSRRESESGG